MYKSCKNKIWKKNKIMAMGTSLNVLIQKILHFCENITFLALSMDFQEDFFSTYIYESYSCLVIKADTNLNVLHIFIPEWGLLIVSI